jgi:hypothetical protein
MNEIALELDGVSVVMEGIQRCHSGQSVACLFRVDFDPFCSSSALIPPRDCLFLAADLKRMAGYVRKHIGENTPHDIEDSGTFVTYGLDFQLQALAGQLERRRVLDALDVLRSPAR